MNTLGFPEGDKRSTWYPREPHTLCKLRTCSVSGLDHRCCQWGWGPAEHTRKREGWKRLSRWFAPAQTEYLTAATTTNGQHPVIHSHCCCCCLSLWCQIEDLLFVWQDEDVVNVQASQLLAFGSLLTQRLSLQRPHFLCGRSQEAFQAFDNWSKVGYQQLFGSIG